MYDRNDREERERVEKVVHDMVDRALEFEGSCTVMPNSITTKRVETWLTLGDICRANMESV